MSREITTHAVNGLNEAIKLFAMDGPGPGGANHHYEMQVDIDHASQVVEIHFQNGPLRETGVNGISNEVLLAIVRDRLEGFQRGAFACQSNQDALEAIVEAMAVLHSRTKERLSRGVEGTHER